MDKHENKLIQIHPQSTRKRVIVFDIDNTLCKQGGSDEEKIIRENHPECPIIIWNKHKHVFLPHLKILFDYLIKHEARVAFFSAACQERNDFLIPALLTSFYGAEKYETLRAKGQFNIHSWEDLCRENRGGEFIYVKDLKTVIQDGESLSDVILVDDDPYYAAYDQHPCLRPIELWKWDLIYNEEDVYRNAKNGVYYMLGLFKTSIEDENYKELALKKAITQIVPIDYSHSLIRETDSFKRSMIDLGLSEVQKEIPDAKLFGTSSSTEGE